jgi:hypothetical protein
MWHLSMITLDQYHHCGPMINSLDRFGYVQGTRLAGNMSSNFDADQCRVNLAQQTLSCSFNIQSTCAYVTFEPLFDRYRLHSLEMNQKQTFRFRFRTWQITPVLIVTSPSNYVHYSVNYTIDRQRTRLMLIIGVRTSRSIFIVVSMVNESFHKEILVSTNNRTRLSNRIHIEIRTIILTEHARIVVMSSINIHRVSSRFVSV